MVCWPSERWEWAAWKRDSLPYYKAIAHESYIVRLWAAKAIGCLHSHVGTDPTTELLDWFRNLEAASPGAAGAFLEGAGWPYDAPIRDVERGYMRRWFLDCLRAGVAPQIPSVQPLEFYAHEYFCRDQEAIREMLRMGRIELAIETATEDSTAQGVLWDVLQEMAASTDPEVSLPIRSYLSR